MRNIGIMVCQVFTYCLLVVPFRLIFGLRGNIDFKFEKGKKYIFASNHPSPLDPLFVAFCLRFEDFIKIVPIRFVTKDEYLRNIFNKIFLVPLGCISSKPTNGKKVLQIAEDLIKKGETIYFFPTGVLERNPSKSEPRVGAVYLERNVSDALIVPIKIINSRISVKVIFKPPFRHHTFPDNLQPLANDVMDKIKRKEYTKLYRLPWSKENNPDGWIEPTTFCQFSCRNCYRGLGEKMRKKNHRDINELKKEIDVLIKQRNIQTLSIAGGEPLMYPNLDELIRYASKKDLKIKVFTNGLLLDEIRLKTLKNLGVTEFIIHIDRHQRKSSSEKKMNLLREKYCKMFRKVRNVNLGFIMPISREDLGQLDDLTDFFKKNSDVINLVVFTIYKVMLPGKKIEPQLKLSLGELSKIVKSKFGLGYCAYLGKIHSEEISWLFSLCFYSHGKLLGCFDKEMYKNLQDKYYKRKGKYFITIKNRPIPARRLLPWIAKNSVRNIFLKYLRSRKEGLNQQVVLLIDAPEKTEDGWDLCEGFPDAMLHNGQLVPSCLLERVRDKEKILV